MKIKNIMLPAVLVAAPAMAITDLPIEVVEVIGDGRQLEQRQLHSESAVKAPAHDAGQLIRALNGMTATRRGGRGFEPIIRGQSQNQVNVITDGAYTFGACPGRMDPPTTYTALDNFDQLTVIKGNRSVIYGAGGSGGTLIFEHRRPQLKNKNLLGSFTLGDTSNSRAQSVSGNLVFGNKQAFGRLFGDIKSADNYEDGDGLNTASSFESASWGLIAGADLSTSHYLEVSHEQVSEDDVWFAGNGMDSPWTDATTDRLKWRYTGKGWLDSFELNVYQSDVDHLMDNYTVRNRMQASNNGMAATSQSQTSGGRLLATVEQAQLEWRFGLDHRANTRNADLFMDMAKDGSYDVLVSIMWPDAELSQTGLFVETDFVLSGADTLRFGGRLDQLKYSASRADESAGMMASATPNTLYESAYGTTASGHTDTAVGLVLGWDHKLDDDKLVSTNISRSVRAADATEQFIARSAGGKRWVGNPDINPELHQQLDVSLIKHGDKGRISATVYWDAVSDYIERYTVETTTLYRNTDATVYGFEITSNRKWGKYLSGGIDLSYTHGESDNGNLGQIAPMEVRTYMDYERANWSFGSEIIAADGQDDFNPSLDAGPSDSFAVWNLYASWQPLKPIRLQAGIENLLNKTYAYHVNSANSDPFNSDPIRVNEPGRELWLKARYSF